MTLIEFLTARREESFAEGDERSYDRWNFALVLAKVATKEPESDA